MTAIRVQVEGAGEEVWVVPLTRLMRVRWAESRKGKTLYLAFEDGLILQVQDPEGALLEEVSRALETDGIYAVGGLWEYTWFRSE